MACGTLVLQPGIKPVPTASEDGVLTAGPLLKQILWIKPGYIKILQLIETI